MKLKRTLQAVAVVAAAGSCFLLPQEESTLTLWLGGPEGLAGLEIEIGGAIPERLFTAADLVAATQFVVPDAGTATVAARLVEDGRTVAGGIAEWELQPEGEWELRISRELSPFEIEADLVENPECGPRCYLMWRFPVAEDAASYEDEALWLILYRLHPGGCGGIFVNCNYDY